MAISTADITRAILAAQNAQALANSYAVKAQQAASQAQALYSSFLRFASTWKGAWSSVSTYHVNDMVEEAGSSYICVSEHSNHSPPNSTYWGLVAAKGDDGGGGGSIFTDGTTIGGDGSEGDPLAFIGEISVHTDGSTITGDGTQGDPLVAVGGGSGTVYTDGVSTEGTGTALDPISIIPSYVQGLVAPTLPKAAANLTDADATKSPASDAASVYTLPAATLSANRVLTLGVSGSPVTNAVAQVIRRDLTNKTYTIKDDAGTTLLVFGASPASPQGATFYYDGTHYVFLNFFYVAV